MKKNDFVSLTVAYYISSAIAFITMYFAVNKLEQSLAITIVNVVIMSNIWAAASTYNLNITIFSQKKVYCKVKTDIKKLFLWNITIGTIFYGYLVHTNNTEIFLPLVLLTSIYFLSYILSASKQFKRQIRLSCCFVLMPNTIKMVFVLLVIFGYWSTNSINLFLCITLITLMYFFYIDNKEKEESITSVLEEKKFTDLIYSISILTNMIFIYAPQFISMNYLSSEVTISVLNSITLIQAAVVPLNTFINRFWISSSNVKTYNVSSAIRNAVLYGFSCILIILITYESLDMLFDIRAHYFPINYFILLVLPLKCAQQYLLTKSSIDSNDKFRLISDTTILMIYFSIVLFIEIDFIKFIFAVLLCETFHLIILAGLNVLSRNNRTL